MMDRKQVATLLAAVLWVLAKASAQDYRTAEVTFVNGATATWEVLAEAPGLLAQRLVTRGEGRVDTVREIGRVASVMIEGDGYYRQVRRTYRDFEGADVEVPRLVRRIVSGPVSLYRLDLSTAEKQGIYEVDSYGAWTYYLEADGELFELPQEERLEGGFYRRSRDFVGRLNYHLRGCSELNRRLREQPPAYRAKALAGVLDLYARCRDSAIVAEPVAKVGFAFAGAFAGVGAYDDGLTSGFALDARVSWRFGKVSGATYLEAGLSYAEPGRGGTRENPARAKLFVPVLIRLELNRPRPVRPFIYTGIFANPVGADNLGDYMRLAFGVGLNAGAFRVDGRILSTTVPTDGQLQAAFGIAAGLRFGRRANVRRRVSEQR